MPVRTCVRDLGGLGLRAFRRALDARDGVGASAAALELPHVGLADALELTLIYLATARANGKEKPRLSGAFKRSG